MWSSAGKRLPAGTSGSAARPARPARAGVRLVAGLAVTGLLAGCALQSPVPLPTPTPTPSPTPTVSATSAAPTPSSTLPPPGEEPSVPPVPSDTPTPTAPAAPLCLAAAGKLSLAQQAGQLVMVGVEDTLDAKETDVIKKNHIGSVILMGTSDRGVKKTAKITAAIQKLGGSLGMLTAVDQEGGAVQRLKGPGFSTIPSAAQQAKLQGEDLFIQARAWGRQLLKAGVHLNLAPVADVVPANNVAKNEPIAKLGRGYGTDPDAVSEKVMAYIFSMRQVGMGSAVKHFPGLGAVTGNTDFATRVVDGTTTVDSPLLEPFRRALTPGEAGHDPEGRLLMPDAVMISSAVYSRIDAKNQAIFSPTVIGLVRSWGYPGVVISDDLGAAKALSKVPAKDRAVRFIAAGGDLAITVTPSAATAMVSGIVARAKANPAFAKQVTVSAARVLDAKVALGLTTCG